MIIAFPWVVTRLTWVSWLTVIGRLVCRPGIEIEAIEVAGKALAAMLRVPGLADPIAGATEARGVHGSAPLWASGRDNSYRNCCADRRFFETDGGLTGVASLGFTSARDDDKLQVAIGVDQGSLSLVSQEERNTWLWRLSSRLWVGSLMIRKKSLEAEITLVKAKLDRLDQLTIPFEQGQRAAQAEEARRVFKDVIRLCDSHPAEPEIESLYGPALDKLRATEEGAFPPTFWEDFQRLRNGDRTGLETAVRFLEADPWFHRSGYFKEYLIRYINRLALTEQYVDRLRKVVLNAIEGRDRREFRGYCRLARKVYSPEWRAELLEKADRGDPSARRRAIWVLDACDRTG